MTMPLDKLSEKLQRLEDLQDLYGTVKCFQALVQILISEDKVGVSTTRKTTKKCARVNQRTLTTMVNKNLLRADREWYYTVTPQGGRLILNLSELLSDSVLGVTFD